MHRTSAAEGEERVVARIPSAVDRHLPNGGSHVLIDDAHHSQGGRHRIESELRAKPGERVVCRRTIKPHRAAEEVIRVEVAKDQVGVGDSRLLTTSAVAGGAGCRTRAAWTDLEDATGVDGRD